MEALLSVVGIPLAPQPVKDREELHLQGLSVFFFDGIREDQVRDGPRRQARGDGQGSGAAGGVPGGKVMFPVGRP